MSEIVAKLSTLWNEQETAEMLHFISNPRYNGGISLPDGTNLSEVFSQIKTLNVGVWIGDTPSLCMSIAPIDTEKKTGLFHIAGDRRLGPGVAEQLVKSWLNRLTRDGYTIRAFTHIEAVGRWARKLGFEFWARDPETGDYVGAWPHT